MSVTSRVWYAGGERSCGVERVCGVGCVVRGSVKAYFCVSVTSYLRGIVKANFCKSGFAGFCVSLNTTFCVSWIAVSRAVLLGLTVESSWAARWLVDLGQRIWQPDRGFGARVVFNASCLVGRAQKTTDTGAQGVRTCGARPQGSLRP